VLYLASLGRLAHLLALVSGGSGTSAGSGVSSSLMGLKSLQGLLSLVLLVSLEGLVTLLFMGSPPRQVPYTIENQ
jgi:hypothetical protein